MWAGLAQSVQVLATYCTVRGSNPGEGEIARTRAGLLWGPLSLLYSGYHVITGGGGVKLPGRGVNHPPPSRSEVKEGVELYICSHCGSSWPVRG
jgi:hypothetical protein